MREIVEREIVEGVVAATPAGRRRRTVTVNLRESPLAWLLARGLIDRRQHEAGERLRGDYETAQLGRRVTMRWDPVPRGASSSGHDPTVAQVSAKQRFDAATGALGRGLSDVAWRVICAGDGLPATERALGWPSRSGRLVLTLALDRLADHYRLP